MKALVVDDELNCRENLTFLINKYCDPITEVKVASSVDEALHVLKDYTPQILFLDVQMPRKDGFTLLKEIDTSNLSVVFTTAHDEFAIKAIKCGPTAYLLKPIDIDELKQAVDDSAELIKKISNNRDNYNEAINDLTHDLENHTTPTKLCLTHSSKLQIIEIKDIIYLVSDSCYTTFHLSDKSKVVMSKTLKTYEDILGDNFIRIHRSFLVNLDFAKEFNFEDGKLKLSNGHKLEVSRRKSNQVVQKLKML